jgi:hypothetical protein
MEDQSMAELKGTFACPICGVDSPHHHTEAEQRAYRQRRDWGIQIGLLQGDPVLQPNERFASQEEAQKRCDDLNSGPPSLRPSAIPIDLNALADEQLDDGDFTDSGEAK